MKRCTVHLSLMDLGVTPCALPLNWTSSGRRRFKCDELRRIRRRCELRHARVDLG